MKNILVVDDEFEIIELLKAYLINNNFKVFYALDGEEALRVYNSHKIDLILLDIMMPKVDGISLLKHIRERSNTPVIFLTAKNNSLDIISGLGLGADDYISKPFNPLEVIARVQAVLRRFNSKKEDYKLQIKNGELRLNRHLKVLYKNNNEIELTSFEYKMVELLMTNTMRVFTKKQLYEQVWNQHYIDDENIIMVYISRLREKIEKDSRRPQYIKTIRGLGYRFERVK